MQLYTDTIIMSSDIYHTVFIFLQSSTSFRQYLRQKNSISKYPSNTFEILIATVYPYRQQLFFNKKDAAHQFCVQHLNFMQLQKMQRAPRR